MKFGFLLLIALFGTHPAFGKECSASDAYAAESFIDSVASWEKLKAAYKKFGSCDDGSIAEGFSVIVARLLTDQWERVRVLRISSANDTAFKVFVLRHIDETWSKQDIRRVGKLATEKCSERERALCRDILAAVRKARKH